MLLNAIVAQIVVLLITALWLALSNRRSSGDTTLKLVTIVCLFLGLYLGGVWVYPPSYGLAVTALLFTFLMAVHFRKTPTSTSTTRNIFNALPVAILLPLSLFLLWQGAIGRLDAKGEIIDLESPFKSENAICVLSGGLSPLLNFHNFPSDKQGDIAQTYGLDFIKRTNSGFRTLAPNTWNPKPTKLDAYAMFEEPVFAPCEGLVVEQHALRPDQAIGESDKINTSGNGVVLQCGDYHVHLHHFKQGTVLPALGDRVSVGQKIGLIGNSGNTIEPHLHLHVETVVEQGKPRVHGKPVHMRFNGRFLARGDCI